jgi:myo-inositol-1(or 4)-monophosphatase
MNSADSSLLKLSREAFRAASDAISDLTNTDAAGVIVRMGADGTPTAKIDIAAEDAIV